MRAAKAQLCFNPAGGRLSSLSTLRIPPETSRAALQPLVLQQEAVPWAGGTAAPPNPPGSLSQELSSSRDLPCGFAGLGLPPCGASVAQGWHIVCVGDEGPTQLLRRAPTLFWEELGACWAGKYSPRAVRGGEGSRSSRGVRKSRLWLRRCFVWI